MNTMTLLGVRMFSAGQIAGIVLICLAVAALIALNVWLIVLLRKRGEHRMHTEQLQRQRDALMQKLAEMRAGSYVAAEEEAEEPEEETAEDESEDESEEDEKPNAPETELVVDEAGAVVRYNRSFTARITQADNDLKARYSELKNYLMSFTGVAARMSWKRETFHIKSRSVASFVVRGKTLCLCLATDPNIFEGTKYKVVDVSGKSGKNTMPCMYRITSDRKTSYAKELIDIILAGFASEKRADYTPADFTLPYKSTEVLIKKRLIKIVGNGVSDLDKENAMAAARGIRYNRSFAARIIQSDDLLKTRYSTVKNGLLGYEKVKAVDSWKRETYRVGKNTVAMFFIRGKTLCLCLSLDPKQFAGTKYKVDDLSEQKAYANTPTMLRLKNDRRVNYALQLIEKAFAEQGVQRAEREKVNYAVPFTATETLIRRGMIKEVKIKPVRFTGPKSAQTAEQTPVNEAAATAEPATEKAEQTTTEEKKE